MADGVGAGSGIVTKALAVVCVAIVAGGAHSLVADPVFVTRQPRQAAPADQEREQTAPAEPSSDDEPPLGEEPTATEEPAAGDAEAAPAALPFPADGYLTLEQAHQHFLAGTPFIDARRAEDFVAGRVLNAWWLPSSRISSGQAEDVVMIIPPEEPVVIYCTGGDCDASENTAMLLEQYYDFERILIMKAGYDDWAAAGYATDSGPDPYGPQE